MMCFSIGSHSTDSAEGRPTSIHDEGLGTGHDERRLCILHNRDATRRERT